MLGAFMLEAINRDNLAGDASRIALVGARLIDGTGREPVLDAVLIIHGRIIECVGSRSNTPIPSDAVLLDVSGLTVMPGMIDCHVHISYTNYALESRLAQHRTVETFQTARMMRKTLQAGFTTIRVPGPRVDPGFRVAADLGLIEAPRLVLAGRLAQVGGHFDSHLPSGVQLPFADAQVCTGVTEVTAAVRQILRDGYDFVKCCTTGDLQDPSEQTQWTLDELRAMVYEASARGKAVMVHAQGTQGIKNAIRAGVWSIEHGGHLDDEAIRMLLDTGTYLVPTLFIVDDIQRRGIEIGVGPVTTAKYREMGHRHAESFARAAAAGVKIATGTDALDENAHGRNARELELMVRYGYTPMQAIVAATGMAAEVCRVSDKVGTLEPGKGADLLVLRSDPLQDITILQDQRQLQLVMKDGRPYVSRLPGLATAAKVMKDAGDAV